MIKKQVYRRQEWGWIKPKVCNSPLPEKRNSWSYNNNRALNLLDLSHLLANSKSLGYIEKGKAEGATVLTGGGPASDKGYFVKPTVFDCKSDDQTILKEEIFGPVIAALSFKDVDDLTKRANNTIYGLSAGIWTRDVGKAHRLARELKAGTVWINCYNCFDAASPFGGFKQSGFGRELGTYALELYTQVKSVWVSLD